MNGPLAIAGFFGIRNTGDEWIEHSWREISERPIEASFRIDSLSRKRLSNFDWVLIGGGSIINRHSKIFQKGGDRLFVKGQKVGFAGISVSGQFDEEQIPALHDLIERSEFFYVRDQRSHDILSHPKVLLGVDLSWTNPIPQQEILEDRDVALALAPCSWKPEFDPADWVGALEGLALEPWPFYFDGARDTDLVRPFLQSIPTRFSPIPLYRSKIVVGSRFHALMFAIQANKPFVAINYDYKVRNFCEDIGLAEFCFEVAEHDRARGCVDVLLQSPDRAKNMIAKANQELQRRANKMKSEIRCHLNSHHPAQSNVGRLRNFNFF
jgi:hypothetical protein